MLDDRPRASDRAGREHRRAGLPHQIARRLDSGQVAVETAQTDAKLADLAEECLDGVPMPRHAETIGHASEVVDPLCCLAIRHRGPIMAQGSARVCRGNALTGGRFAMWWRGADSKTPGGGEAPGARLAT